MTLKEVYESAQKLSANERKELAKLLLDSLPLVEDEVKAKQKAAMRDFLETAGAVQAQFKEEHGDLSEEEQEALVNQWINEARESQ